MHTQEVTRVGLRQKQLREQQCAHINSMKIHNQWRKIMRVAKVEELRGEVEILSQNHERRVDRKDALVQVRVLVGQVCSSVRCELMLLLAALNGSVVATEGIKRVSPRHAGSWLG